MINGMSDQNKEPVSQPQAALLQALDEAEAIEAFAEALVDQGFLPFDPGGKHLYNGFQLFGQLKKHGLCFSLLTKRPALLYAAVTVARKVRRGDYLPCLLPCCW
jgi:hypothetical protein